MEVNLLQNPRIRRRCIERRKIEKGKGGLSSLIRDEDVLVVELNAEKNVLGK
jgi:hypothetical protein